jgi:hypothetical protein
MFRGPYVIAWVLTGLYFFSWLVGYSGVFLSFMLGKESTPNTVGDFLAGFFAPLAITWLVAGQLENSIQIKAVSDREEKRERERLKPKFVIAEKILSENKNEVISVEFNLRNVRADAYDIVVIERFNCRLFSVNDGSAGIIPGSGAVFVSHYKSGMVVRFAMRPTQADVCGFSLSGFDGLGDEIFLKVRFNVQSHRFSLSEESPSKT